MRKKLEIMVLVLALMASNSFAAVNVIDDLGSVEVPEVEAKTTTIVGLGLGAIPDYEGSKDYKASPIPFIRSQMASGQFLQITGATLSINVVPSKTIQFGPVLRYRAERNEDVENEQVKLMETVDAAVEAGGFVGFQHKNWTAKFEMVQDTANGHGGALSTLSAGYKIPLPPKAAITINLSTSYADEDYMHAYFSVDGQNKGLSSFTNYDADAGIKDAAGTVIANYFINPQWGVIGVLRYTKLLGDAADSPLVADEGEASQMTVGVLATYKF